MLAEGELSLRAPYTNQQQDVNELLQRILIKLEEYGYDGTTIIETERKQLTFCHCQNGGTTEETDMGTADNEDVTSEGHTFIVLPIVKADGSGHYKSIVECLCGFQSQRTASR